MRPSVISNAQAAPRQSSALPRKRSNTSGVSSRIELWDRQRDAYEFVIARDVAALLAEQRTGKTFVTMKVLETLADDQFCGVLVCLLNNRDSTWKDKLAEYLPQLNVTDDWELFKKLPAPRLFLVHFEMLPRLIAKLVRYKKINWMGIDEAHRIAKRGTKQSRAAGRMSWVKRKLILTGTPIEKQPTDMWAQFRFLAPWVFGVNWDKFEREYMDYPRLKFDHIPRGSKRWQQKILQQRILRSKATFKKSKLRKFVGLIEPYAYRMTKKDVGIIEPEVHKVVVPLLGPQRRYYEAMERTSVVRLDTGQRALAELEVTNIMKRRQLASGFVYDDEEEVHYVGDAKLRRLKSMVDRLPKPIVVFTAFRPDLERIVETIEGMGLDVIAVHGKVNKKLRPDIWRKFQKAQYDVIVCQIKTGGVGVDLWKANTAIVHSMGHSFIDWDQAKSRLDSRDKKKPPRIYVLCGANTVDEELFELVIVKRFNSEEVLSRLERRPSWHGRAKRRPKPPRRRSSSTR